MNSIAETRDQLMPYFRCLIRGENFPRELEGESKLLGFYVNRFVEAADEVFAEAAALALLRQEPKLTLPPGIPRPTNSAVYFEEIEAVKAIPSQPQGFVWFPMDE